MAFVAGGEFMMGTDDREGFTADGQCELFHLRNDHHEMGNLFSEQAHRDRIRELAARVRIWQVRTRDAAPLPAV